MMRRIKPFKAITYEISAGLVVKKYTSLNLTITTFVVSEISNSVYFLDFLVYSKNNSMILDAFRGINNTR